ncbi:LacI family transcriptional regulator [Blautia sp. An249]|uniref:LacI family DNA-binding transcriptional regulator n=1 Tax=Blautia sp. An249 TaxID=1965603 RepID=UPI000B38778C|nr:LacI family DNA-binding transcriptional regulator [Blautia sp. An249]OUO75639.1 LacI family transcriptional regulator [Blautia sp. An249]
MTLKDIAKEAGVSISTVSRVINNKACNAASKDTQDKIWSIVRKTGYTPNPAAQTLKKGNALVNSDKPTRFIDCLQARSTNIDADPFFFELERAIEQEAFNHNCIVKRSFAPADIRDMKEITSLQGNLADGVVILGRFGFSQAQMNFLNDTYKNVIYVGLNPTDLKCDQVICNGYDASVSAVKYLFELRHKKIGYIGEQKNECRFLGYKDALTKLNLPFSITNTANVIQTIDGGYQGAKQLIQRGVDISAVFCANDLTAIGAIKGFSESKRNVPKDISVISIDDISMAQYLSPMLTTIHVPIEELGKIATKTLLDRIQYGHRLPLKIELPYYIAKRDSCLRYRT